ncbi:MAG: M56 family metallopeptidase, partial [Verrucomicrobiales bacterium]
MLPIDGPAAQAEPPTAAERIRPALPWVVGVWALGVALLSARLLSGWLCLRRWRASGKEIADPVWRARFAALGERMRLSRPVRLLASASAAVPMVAGWIKPVVLVPAGLFTGLDAAQLEAILAHELAHIRRHDYLVNLLQNAVETLFFFHPAVWWISGEIRQEREHCCDDEAAALCGGAVGYARALAALEEIRSIDGAPLGAVSAAGGSLLCRVRRLLGVSFREPSATVPWSVGIAAALLAAGLIVGAHVVNAAPDGKAAVELPDAPDHNLAAALVERWQTLEGKDSPIPEARVAGMRRAIDQWNEENRIETDVVESVYALKGWASDQRNHPAGEVKRWLNAIAAITSHPVQIALNNEPMIGRVLKKEELAKLAFGPPSESGLRAAWSLSPNKDTYVFGDIAYGTITLWNTSGETIMTGNGWGGENP